MATAANLPNGKNPYPGPDAYDENYTLYGRDKETQYLLDLLLTRRIVLLHSPSGAGKTSLMQAKIIPSLRNEYKVFPHPTVRLHQIQSAAQDIDKKMNRYIYSTQYSLMGGNNERIEHSNLVEFSDKWIKQVPGIQQHFLFFDQFEEVFSQDEHDIVEKEVFFKQLGQLLYDRKWMAVFAIREEFVSILEVYERFIPNNLSTHYRLERLDYSAAFEAIAYPLKDYGYQYDNGAADALIRNLMGGKSKYVEPIQLQVVCSNLWKKIITEFKPSEPDNPTIIPESMIENFDVDSAIQQFYEDVIHEAALKPNTDINKIRDWFDHELIDKGDDNKRPQRKWVLKPNLSDSISPEVVTVLEERRLIRQLPPQEDRILYELTHDRLIDPILKSNTEAAKPRLRRKFLLRASAIIGASIVVLIIASIVLLLAIQATTQAKNAREYALLARNQALQALLANVSTLADNSPLLALALAVEVAASDNAPAQSQQVLANLAAAPGVRQRIIAPASITSLMFHPDGSAILSAATDGSIILWDTEAGAEIRRYGEATSSVNSIAFNLDGTQFVSGSDDNTLTLWDVTTGQEIRRFDGHSKSVTSVAFSPVDRTLLSASADGSIILWDTEAGAEIRRYGEATSSVNSIAFKPDGTQFVSGSDDGALTLWDVATGQEIHRFEGHIAPVTSVAFSLDMAQILSGSEDTDMILWDAETGEIIQVFKHDTDVLSVAFRSNGTIALVGLRNGGIVQWNTDSGEQIRRFTLNTGPVSSMVFSRDESMMAIGSNDAQLLIWGWEFENPSIVAKSDELGLILTNVAVNPQEPSTALFSGCRGESEDDCLSNGNGQLILWNLSEGVEIGRFENEANLNGLLISKFSAEGNRILTVATGGSLFLWDASTGAEIRSFIGEIDARPIPGLVLAADIAPDSTRILSGGCVVQAAAAALPLLAKLAFCNQGELIVWDAVTGQPLHQFEELTGVVTSVAFSPDGLSALTGSSEGILTLWDIDASSQSFGSVIRRFEGHTGQSIGVFSPDGATILSGSIDTALILWDTATGQRIRSFSGHTASINSVAFSPNGEQAVSSSEDKTIILWNVAAAEILRRFEGHSDGVTSAVFTPDGRHILSAADNGNYILWNANESLSDILAWTFANRYIREITCDERASYGLDREPFCSETSTFPTRTPFPSTQSP